MKFFDIYLIKMIIATTIYEVPTMGHYSLIELGSWREVFLFTPKSYSLTRLYSSLVTIFPRKSLFPVHTQSGVLKRHFYATNIYLIDRS
jgi:hypothetical protein